MGFIKMETSASKLIVRNLRKSFRTQRSEESVQVFEGISFEVYPSEFISLVGPSGCGKTTFFADSRRAHSSRRWRNPSRRQNRYQARPR